MNHMLWSNIQTIVTEAHGFDLNTLQVCYSDQTFFASCDIQPQNPIGLPCCKFVSPSKKHVQPLAMGASQIDI